MTQITLAAARDLPRLLTVIAIVIVVLFVLPQLFGQAFYHRLRGTLPFVGKLWTWSGQKELAGTLAVLVEQRLPLPDAMGYAADMIGDQNVARACRQVCRSTEQGVALSDAMAGSIHFDRILSALVRWGEDHDLVAAALGQAGQFFTERIEHQVEFVRRLIPLVTLILVGTVIGWVVFSLFLPLVKLIEGLS